MTPVKTNLMSQVQLNLLQQQAILQGQHSLFNQNA